MDTQLEVYRYNQTEKKRDKESNKNSKSERLNGTERVTLTVTDYKLSERERVRGTKILKEYVCVHMFVNVREKHSESQRL